MNPEEYIVSEDATTENVDLDREDVRLPDGRRLTDELGADIPRRSLAAARRRNLIPGRKSLSGGKTHSPHVSFRVPANLRQRAEEVAEAEGVTVSRLGRKALEEYLQAHGGQ